MGRYTKEEAIRIVVSCAQQYRDNLANKTLLLVYAQQDNVSNLELSFSASNYLHLTGLQTQEGISATDFYNRCLSQRLRLEDFNLSKNGTSDLKLDILPKLINKNLSARMIGDYNSAMPKLYTEKLVGGVSACMGFLSIGTSNKYVPNTVLKVDIRNYVNKPAKVIAIYRKPKEDLEYREITYMAKNIVWEKLNYPAELIGLPRFAE